MRVKLLEQEKIVLGVVQEYLNKNRQFDLENIVPFIKSRFRLSSVNINYNGIITILESLAKKKMIVEGSKFTRDDVLKNEKRRKIYYYIIEIQCAYFNKIVKDLSISNHVVVWHLSMLLKFDFIQKATLENHEVYFNSEVHFESIKKECYSTKEKSEVILNYLKQNNIGITKTQLSLDLNMHLNTVTKYLLSLEKFNIISKETISKKILYFLNEDYI